jgi:DNA-binding IclR family transcriptional regulator
MDEKESYSKYILSSLSNALEVIDELGKEGELSIPEISEKTGLGKSSLFRILATLESKKFVTKTLHARYNLGLKFISLGNAVIRKMGIERAAHPYLMELTAESGETSHMGVLDGAVDLLFVDKVVSSSSIHMDSLVGFRRKAHVVGCGKAILAYQSEAYLDAYMKLADFSALTPNSITSPEELKKDLERIRRDGYSVDNEESEAGLFCVAAPVLDANNQALAAVSISGPVDRMKRSLKKNIQLIKNTAEKISQELL